MPAILLQSLLGFEPHDGRWITGVLVGVDDPRRRMVLSAQGFGEKFRFVRSPQMALVTRLLGEGLHGESCMLSDAPHGLPRVERLGPLGRA